MVSSTSLFSLLSDKTPFSSLGFGYHRPLRQQSVGNKNVVDQAPPATLRFKISGGGGGTFIFFVIFGDPPQLILTPPFINFLNFMREYKEVHTNIRLLVFCYYKRL